MKNKVTLLVLMVEIIAIVVLHSVRSSGKPGTDKAEMQTASTQYPIVAEKQPISYSSLK